ncbi:hypothetical protein [Paraburkholderia hayleyella]|uniref:hypothetical protein n=1 Tax=Paraburkholderia hayleyella TaxID=2152889 RepID=UPI00129200B6|nr:hypothetical protein [Paraburkholderia hayleyella]
MTRIPEALVSRFQHASRAAYNNAPEGVKKTEKTQAPSGKNRGCGIFQCIWPKTFSPSGSDENNVLGMQLSSLNYYNSEKNNQSSEKINPDRAGNSQLSSVPDWLNNDYSSQVAGQNKSEVSFPYSPVVPVVFLPDHEPALLYDASIFRNLPYVKGNSGDIFEYAFRNSPSINSDSLSPQFFVGQLAGIRFNLVLNYTLRGGKQAGPQEQNNDFLLTEEDFILTPTLVPNKGVMSPVVSSGFLKGQQPDFSPKTINNKIYLSPVPTSSKKLSEVFTRLVTLNNHSTPPDFNNSPAWIVNSPALLASSEPRTPAVKKEDVKFSLG